MASGKKLINAPDDAVNESLSGLCLLYPQLEYHPSKRVVLSPDWKTRSGKVAIISGGGGGHEPYAAGFVGSGLLTGAITGPVFASPPSNHILHALQCVSTNNTAGILVIVPNYTGDCLNFGTAIEKARDNGVSVPACAVHNCFTFVRWVSNGEEIDQPRPAKLPRKVPPLFILSYETYGVKLGPKVGDRNTYDCNIRFTQVTELTVGEDCSIPTSELGRAGRRGLVGMLFVGKVAGALAERGLNLSSVAQYAEIVTNNVATYAVGLTACALPGQGRMFHVPHDEMEIGLGVHGEAGYKRMKLMSASQVVSLMLQHILKTLSLINGEAVAVIVNNFGATSQLEQGIVVHEVVTQLGCRGIQPLRVYAGALMTSLDGAGVQISILRLGDHHGTSLVSCLDQATDAPCWPGSVYSVSLPSRGVGTFQFASSGDANKKIAKVGPTLNEAGENLLRKCLKRACLAIIDKENYINELDTGCGDGDCGTTLRRLAEGISSSLENLPLSHPSSVLTALSVIAEDTMGGTSGAIYSLMFTTAAAELKLSKCGQVCPLSWSQTWRGGIDGILRYSKARPGDRTMLDALDPACREFESNDFSDGLRKEALVKIAKAVQAGCESTKHMEARAGRASYVKQTTFLQKVDAGAFAVATWIAAIVSTLLESYD